MLIIAKQYAYAYTAQTSRPRRNKLKVKGLVIDKK